MPQFGKDSRAKLNTCHKDLQLICEEVIKNIDFTVTEGAREDAKQMQYFKEGKSKLDGVKQRSKHQVTKEEPLSYAVDIAPYPVNYANKPKTLARFYMLAGYMFQASAKLFEEGKITHKIRWGGDWDGDKDFTDNTFDDLPHFELIKA